MCEFISLNAFSQLTFAKVTVAYLRMYTKERRALVVFGLILHACNCTGINRIRYSYGYNYSHKLRKNSLIF